MGASDRIQRCVREYERAFRRLTENAAEGFWISDPEFRTIYVNPAFGEILRVAHASGYFETPRRTTGAELAERLDINRSTFHRTLRAAEQTTFDALLE